MKTIEAYIETCLKRSNSQVNYFLQCQSCSGSAQEKLGYQILKAEAAEQPTYVVWFGNGFTLDFIEKCRQFPNRGNYLGLYSVEDFCQAALSGELTHGQ